MTEREVNGHGADDDISRRACNLCLAIVTKCTYSLKLDFFDWDHGRLSFKRYFNQVRMKSGLNVLNNKIFVFVVWPSELF